MRSLAEIMKEAEKQGLIKKTELESLREATKNKFGFDDATINKIQEETLKIDKRING